MSNWMETLEQTQNRVEGLCTPPGLGTLQDPQRGAGGHSWEGGCLGYHAQPVASVTWWWKAAETAC